MKPPQGMALVRYPEGLDAKMNYQLRERGYLTLEDMQKGVVSVEENILEKRNRLRSEKRVTYKDDIVPSTSTSDTKIDNLVKVMKRMLEKINLNDRVPPREPQNNQNRNRNQNYRRENNQDKKK